MRAPFQILAIPYRIINENIQFCVFHRSDHDQWQFVAGGGEDSETPLQAAIREIFEETGYSVKNIHQLQTRSSIPVNIFKRDQICHWDKGKFVIPEFSFGFLCEHEIKLSDEHIDFVWLSYNDAHQKLKWDSNKTALFELMSMFERGMLEKNDPK